MTQRGAHAASHAAPAKTRHAEPAHEDQPRQSRSWDSLRRPPPGLFRRSENKIGRRGFPISYLLFEKLKKNKQKKNRKIQGEILGNWHLLVFFPGCFTFSIRGKATSGEPAPRPAAAPAPWPPHARPSTARPHCGPDARAVCFENIFNLSVTIQKVSKRRPIKIQTRTSPSPSGPFLGGDR